MYANLKLDLRNKLKRVLTFVYNYRLLPKRIFHPRIEGKLINTIFSWASPGDVLIIPSTLCREQPLAE